MTFLALMAFFRTGSLSGSTHSTCTTGLPAASTILEKRTVSIIPYSHLQQEKDSADWHHDTRSPPAHTLIDGPESIAQRCEQNTGWKPMLHYAVAPTLPVRGE